jgi:hypothetical protein
MRVPPVVANREGRRRDLHAQLAVGQRNCAAPDRPVRRVCWDSAPATLARTYWQTLLTRARVAADDRRDDGARFVTRFGGLDATMGLAFAQTGALFAFFSPLLGWLGVALTGSDTSSNVLFGNLQQISANQVGLAVLAAAANSSGGVMGKMIDAQSIVVAGVATEQQGHEGRHPALRVPVTVSRWPVLGGRRGVRDVADDVVPHDRATSQTNWSQTPIGSAPAGSDQGQLESDPN